MSIDINNFKDYKKCFASSFSLTDNDGRNYLFVRSFNQKRNGWFNIAKREIIAKDKSVPKGYAGIFPDAVWFSDEEVAEIVAQVEERQARMERVEASLREWIEFRRAWSRKPSKNGKLQFAKKEVSK